MRELAKSARVLTYQEISKVKRRVYAGERLSDTELLDLFASIDNYQAVSEYCEYLREQLDALQKEIEE
jgi:hypothetical protein